MSATLLVTSSSTSTHQPQQSLPHKRRNRSSSLRAQFSNFANRVVQKFVSSVSFQIVQRRNSFSGGEQLRLISPEESSEEQLKEVKKMSSRSHRKVNFNVSEQYEILDIIGEGAYGVVAYHLKNQDADNFRSALHRPTGQKVAIKKITPFDHSMFCLRTLREMKLLRYFSHENVPLFKIRSNKDHFNPRHSKTKEFRYIHRSLSHPGTVFLLKSDVRNSWKQTCIASSEPKTSPTTTVNTSFTRPSAH